MKNIITILFLLSFTATAFAMTVGGQADMSVPEASLFSKSKAVEYALDDYESAVKMKAGFDTEFIVEKKFHAPQNITDARIEGGQNMNLKFSMNYSNVLEPYVKIGTSDLKVKWKQDYSNVVVDTKPGLVLGGGLKAKLWEVPSAGIKLTLDGQYKDINLDFDKAEIDGLDSTGSVINEGFDIHEWQISLIASKKLIFGMQDCYMVPYAGITYSNSDVKVNFTNSGTGMSYVIDDTSNENKIGVVLGCDMAPSLLSWYLLSLELRFINETAFTLSGTMKF